MTFDDVISRVSKRLNQTSAASVTRIGETTNDVYKKVTSSIGLNTSRRTEVQANATISSQFITFTGIEKVISVIDKSSGQNRFLDEVMVDELDRSASLDTPTRYAIYRSNAQSVQIKINTVAQSAFTLYAPGYVLAPTLSGSQEPAFPESYHDVLVSGVLYEEYMKLEKPTLAKIELAKYDDRMGDLRLFIAQSPQQDIYHGKLAGTSIPGASTSGGSGGSGTSGSTSYTQTGLVTFDRTGQVLGLRAPFAVAVGSEVVANLIAASATVATTATNALALGGQVASYYVNASNLASGTVPLARISGLTNTEIANAAAIAWTKVSKAGSSLADLATRSAADLSSGIIPDARVPGLTSDGATRIRRLAFDATQVPSSDVNTLDDYEEGSWTPSIAGAGGTTGQTYGSQVGRYVKVGRLVTVFFRSELTAKGTITGNAQISGLPFISDNTANLVAVGSLSWANLGTNWVNVTLRLLPGGVAAYLEGAAAAGVANVTNLSTSDITNTTVFAGTLTYLAQD